MTKKMFPIVEVNEHTGKRRNTGTWTMRFIVVVVRHGGTRLSSIWKYKILTSANIYTDGYWDSYVTKASNGGEWYRIRSSAKTHRNKTNARKRQQRIINSIRRYAKVHKSMVGWKPPKR